MTNFRFIHAADLHLDSPLIGLAAKSQDYASRVDDASRQAFDNLIALAIDEECRLIVIAGDVFDGQWRDYRTGLFFADRMRKLRDAGIRVVMIAGNHDAENRFAARLDYSENVKLLSARRPESFAIDDLGVVVHGRSFPQRDVYENLARDYPAPVVGAVNIGLLHTACGGSDVHENYAPCSVEQLANHGYHYWALGHVHAWRVLSEAPYVVYSGNLQGRSIRETGSKGATLVEVVDGQIATVEHRALDVIRWASEDVDLTHVEQRNALLPTVQEAIERTYGSCEGRALAIRLRLVGSTLLHAELVENIVLVREEIEMLAASTASDIWVEKIEVRTESVARGPEIDPTIAGALKSAVESLAAGANFAARIDARIAEIRVKLPPAAQSEQWLQTLRNGVLDRARNLAQAVIEKGEG
ncbi:metallophosphoesterase family protein, partial [Rhodoblastus sp.]|uniref:metallophosphoesterase family protein n=1 Tax=Rhodoblastus sp. TaxID=1962975 RepID=UPI003F9C3F3B